MIEDSGSSSIDVKKTLSRTHEMVGEPIDAFVAGIYSLVECVSLLTPVKWNCSVVPFVFGLRVEERMLSS